MGSVLEEEKWEISIDQHLVVRETPTAKVRENVARIRREMFRTQQEDELTAIHVAENLDENLPPIVRTIKPSWKMKWDAYCDKIAVTICRYVHQYPEAVKLTDTYLTCMTCRRKYALPWADPSKWPADAYRYSSFIGPTERTQQVELRSKAHARIV